MKAFEANSAKGAEVRGQFVALCRRYRWWRFMGQPWRSAFWLAWDGCR